MNPEVHKILEMLEQGKISAEQAEKLLAAVDSMPACESHESHKKRSRWLKVRVYENGADKPKVNVNLPLGLMKVLLKLGAKFSDKVPAQVQAKLQEKGVNLDLDGLTPEQLEEIFASLTQEGPLKLVEVDEEHEKVEVFLE